MTLQATIVPQDQKLMTEAEWDTIIRKIISIINSHGLAMKGSTKPMGLYEPPSEMKEVKEVKEPEPKSNLILPR